MNVLTFLLSERWAARVTLVLALGAFYAGTILINNELLFPFAEVDGTVFWFFFPEGIKFLLVMSLGVRGAVAIGVGRAVVTLNQYPDAGYVNGLATGALMTLSTLVAMKLGSVLANVRFPWRELRPSHLAMMALIFAIMDTGAKLVYEIHILSNTKLLGADLDQIFLIEAFGRFAGILAFIYLVTLYRKAIVQAG